MLCIKTPNGQKQFGQIDLTPSPIKKGDIVVWIAEQVCCPIHNKLYYAFEETGPGKWFYSAYFVELPEDLTLTADETEVKELEKVEAV